MMAYDNRRRHVILMEFIVWAVVAPLGLLTLALALELVAGLAAGDPVRRQLVPIDAVVIVPAHDEEMGIADTVASLVPIGGVARVLVVADNCSDATAFLARSAGADVIERIDPAHVGKGYALAFAQAYLAKAPPQVVGVIDADCRIDQISLSLLLNAAQVTPVQALNLLDADRSAAPMVQVSNFAFFIRNDVRQRGLSRLAGRVHLTGTGMAFPWTVFGTAALATGDIVEDLGLGLDLAASGLAPQLVPEARVTSPAAAKTSALKQRARWEGGFLATARRRGLPIIAAGIGTGDFATFWSGVSLCIPPLALLLLLNGVVIAACGAIAATGGSFAPSAFLTIVTAFVVGLFVWAWLDRGHAYLAGTALMTAPLYIFWKLPMYARLILPRERRWTRSDRDTPT
jgi:hypothetical protein